MAKRTKSKTIAPNRKKPTKTAGPAKTAKAAELPKDSVMLIVILQAKPGQEKQLEAELCALVAPTRREEGCLRYGLYAPAASDAPGAFLLYEVWASREHHARHTQTPHFQRWAARKDGVLETREAAFWKQIA